MKTDNILRMIETAEVEWKALGEVAEVSAGNSAPQNQDLFLNGIYPFCRTSDVGRVHHSVNFSNIQDKLNQDGIKGLRLFPKETILLPKSGASTLLNHRVMLAVDSYVSSHLATIYRKEEFVLAKYLFYFLSGFDINQLIPDKSYPSLKVSEIANIQIPVPPLSLQKEIVKILDKMTELEATLEAELALRAKQYRYYRDLLLDFNNRSGGGNWFSQSKNPFSGSLKVEWKTLGEVGTLIRGNGLQKKDFTESGVPAIHYGQIYTYYGTFAEKTKSFVSNELAKKLKQAQYGDVLIAGTSENIDDVMKPVGWLGGEIVFSGDMFAFRPTNEVNTKYLTYLLQTTYFQKFKEKYAQGTKVIRVNSANFLKFQIPIPPLETQAKIVAILDKFDTLTHSISEGLPKEIVLRRKQYEYYRERLLNFRRQ